MKVFQTSAALATIAAVGLSAAQPALAKIKCVNDSKGKLKVVEKVKDLATVRGEVLDGFYFYVVNASDSDYKKKIDSFRVERSCWRKDYESDATYKHSQSLGDRKAVRLLIPTAVGSKTCKKVSVWLKIGGQEYFQSIDNVKNGDGVSLRTKKKHEIFGKTKMKLWLKKVKNCK